MGCRGRGRIGLVEGGWRKRVSIHLSPSPSSLLQWLPTLTHLRQPCPCSSSSPKSTSAQCRTLFIWQWPGTRHFFALFLTCTIYHSDSRIPAEHEDYFSLEGLTRIQSRRNHGISRTPIIVPIRLTTGREERERSPSSSFTRHTPPMTEADAGGFLSRHPTVGEYSLHPEYPDTHLPQLCYWSWSTWSYPFAVPYNQRAIFSART